MYVPTANTMDVTAVRTVTPSVTNGAFLNWFLKKCWKRSKIDINKLCELNGCILGISIRKT